MGERVLVVGARGERSLGALVAHHVREQGFEPVTAGLHGEDHHLDVRQRAVPSWFRRHEIRHIVCTAGYNVPVSSEAYTLRDRDHKRVSWAGWYLDHLQTNVIGPMMLLEAFREARNGSEQHFVAISSNSAHIARTESAAYCASKAALSMALRVKAREIGLAEEELVVYGYEPGLLAGTPMTKDVQLRIPGRLHRMPGQPTYGISTERLAMLIAFNLRNGGRELNGCLLRIDGGEQ